VEGIDLGFTGSGGGESSVEGIEFGFTGSGGPEGSVGGTGV
jgi:hypothetical protein